MTYSITWTKEDPPFRMPLMTTTVPRQRYNNCTTEGEVWECSVVVSDGTDNSNIVTASATMAPPFTGNGAWSPAQKHSCPSVNQSAIQTKSTQDLGFWGAAIFNSARSCWSMMFHLKQSGINKWSYSSCFDRASECLRCFDRSLVSFWPKLLLCERQLLH